MKKAYQAPNAILVSVPCDDIIRTSTLTDGVSGGGSSQTWGSGAQ